MKKLLGAVYLALAALIGLESFGVIREPLGIADKIATNPYGSIAIQAWQSSGVFIKLTIVIFCIILFAGGVNGLFGDGMLIREMPIYLTPTGMAAFLAPWLPALWETHIDFMGDDENVFGVSWVTDIGVNDTRHITYSSLAPLVFLILAVLICILLELIFKSKGVPNLLVALLSVVITAVASPLIVFLEIVVTSIATVVWEIFSVFAVVGAIILFFVFVFSALF